MRQRFVIPLLDGPYLSDKTAKLRTIYRCQACGQLSANLYDQGVYARYYASLPDDYHCDHDRDLSRYRRILGLFRNQPLKKVLDIGCGTGTFLEMFPAGVERFGIEPSKAAAQVARQKGIKIVGYDDLAKPELRNTFDLVTAIDVVEHTPNLDEFRGHLATALRSGGSAALLTGDAESKSARLLGRYWYYLNFAEHVTVFCPRSMRIWLEPDFSEIDLTKAEHHRLSSRENLVLMRAWILFPVKWALRKLFPARFSIHAPLYAAGGHMLVRAIRKPLEAQETAVSVD